MEIDTRVVSRGLKILQDLIHKHSIPLDTMKYGKVAAVHLIDRLCNDISEITTEHIAEIKLLCQLYEDTLSTCTPSTQAAGIIHYYCIANDIDGYLETILSRSGVSHVSIEKVTLLLPCISI